MIRGHKASVSLEDKFWRGLKDIAKELNVTMTYLVSTIDAERKHANLSSAIRLYVLDYFRSRSAPLENEMDLHFSDHLYSRERIGVYRGGSADALSVSTPHPAQKLAQIPQSDEDLTQLESIFDQLSEAIKSTIVEVSSANDKIERLLNSMVRSHGHAADRRDER
jgi:predicted DNA-binding ribbon-helix-helix protein